MLAPALKRPLRLACFALSTLLLALSCSDEEPLPSAEGPDGGVPACELGTSGCGCAPVTGCRAGLLCIAMKCLPTEGGQGGVPNDSDVPDLPSYGGGGPTLEDDGGTTPSADAAVDAAPAPDTGAPPPPDPDAGDGG